MNKISYIKISQQEANTKIWNALLLKYQSIKGKNKLVGYLWLPFACAGFGLIAVFGWFAYLTVFFQDVRFTPHYLRTAIKHDKMTTEQANAFLHSQMKKYKESLSHGHFSLKSRSSIEATFELLYKEYPLQELPNAETQKIISNIQGVKNSVSENLVELKQIVSEGNSEIKTISQYTKKKDKEEEAEKIRKSKLKEDLAKQKVSDYNREKGRMLNSFEADLSAEQLDILTECCNKAAIFTRKIEKWELEDILLCIQKEPLQLDVNKHIAFLFNELKEHNLICHTWMSVAERYRCFISKKGSPITSKDLSSALSNASTIKKEVEDEIKNSISRIISI